jgi:hypothetical protein
MSESPDDFSLGSVGLTAGFHSTIIDRAEWRP